MHYGKYNKYFNKLILYYKNKGVPGQYTPRSVTLDDLSPLPASDMNCHLPLDFYAY